MTQPDRVFTEVDGLRLHHLDWGGSGPPVVCLHGLTGNAHAFDGLARSLAPGLRILCLDVRGRGDSEWGPPEGYQLPRYVADLGIWLDALHLDHGLVIINDGSRYQCVLPTIPRGIVSESVSA